jgi:hypothetical protein
MQFSQHQRARRMADRSLVEGISRDEQQWLSDHRKQCAECAEYEQQSARIVRGFNAFALEMEPGANARAQDAIAKRAIELECTKVSGESKLTSSSLVNPRADFSVVKLRKVFSPPVRRVGIVGAAIAAVVLLTIAVIEHESSRTLPIDAQHQSSQSPQLVAAPNTPPMKSAPIISTQTAPVATHIQIHRPPKPLVGETDFIPLDDGPPVIEGTIVRITMPESYAIRPHRRHKGYGVPAEVLVDDAGLVRAIRFLE